MAINRTVNADTSVTYTLTVDGTTASNMDSAFLGLFPYSATVTDSTGAVTPNPIARADWPCQCVLMLIKKVVSDWIVLQKQKQAAADAASAAATQTAGIK